jgi:hypothetical protein
LQLRPTRIRTSCIKHYSQAVGPDCEASRTIGRLGTTFENGAEPWAPSQEEASTGNERALDPSQVVANRDETGHDRDSNDAGTINEGNTTNDGGVVPAETTIRIETSARMTVRNVTDPRDFATEISKKVNLNSVTKSVNLDA